MGWTYNCKEEDVTKKMMSFAAASTMQGDVLGSALPLQGWREGCGCLHCFGPLTTSPGFLEHALGP